MYSIQLKNKVLTLRKQGKSIYEIAEKLSLSPTTVSYWCKNILLSEKLRSKISQNGKLKARAGMLVYTENLRQQRLQRTTQNKREGARMIGAFSPRDLLLVGLGLYWGEGYKYDNSELGFTNSNPRIIHFYMKWLELFNISKRDLILKLTINNAFKSHEKHIKKYWMSNLKIPLNQFTKTTLIRTNLKKADSSHMGTYFGILRIKVRRGKDLRDKIMGAIEYLSSCA